MPIVNTTECSYAKSCGGIAVCAGIRKDAVSLFQERNIWTAKELVQALQRKGLGVSARRGSLEFLAAQKCRWITISKCMGSKKPIRFQRHGRIFALKSVSEMAMSEKLKTLLTRFQRHMLESLDYYDRKAHYLSAYDLRRILPYPGHQVEFTASRLRDFGLAKMVEADGTAYYCLPSRFNWLKTHVQEAVLKDKIEYQAINALQGLFINLYPVGLLLKTKGVMRASKRDPEVLRSTGGMTFDIVHEFKTPVIDRNFLVVDVYSRIPVTGYVVNSFMKKIEWAKSGMRSQKDVREDDEDKNRPLKNKAFGMIVYRIANREAINIANANNIRFIKLRELRIDYAKLREQAALILKK